MTFNGICRDKPPNAADAAGVNVYLPGEPKTDTLQLTISGKKIPQQTPKMNNND